MASDKPLFVLVLAGPTASGKTSMAIRLARHYHTEIVSADSRQFYREMRIGTAAPTAEELKSVPHHFISHLTVAEPYDVARYETEALALLSKLHEKHQLVVLTGGSGLYIDAVCMGLDNIPETSAEVRNKVNALFQQQGLEGLQLMLSQLDPAYYKVVDKRNPRRLQRAIEVCLQTGNPYSFYRKRLVQPRPFKVIWTALEVERVELINRINMRVEHMLSLGLLDEVRSLYPYRHLNALNTVGYQELFRYLDKTSRLEEAISEIKVNTKQYAKRQMTWFRKNKQYQWFDSLAFDRIVAVADQQMKS